MISRRRVYVVRDDYLDGLFAGETNHHKLTHTHTYKRTLWRLRAVAIICTSSVAHDVRAQLARRGGGARSDIVWTPCRQCADRARKSEQTTFT